MGVTEAEVGMKRNDRNERLHHDEEDRLLPFMIVLLSGFVGDCSVFLDWHVFVKSLLGLKQFSLYIRLPVLVTMSFSCPLSTIVPDFVSKALFTVMDSSLL